jgi:hypothetical protein
LSTSNDGEAMESSKQSIASALIPNYASSLPNPITLPALLRTLSHTTLGEDEETFLNRESMVSVDNKSLDDIDLRESLPPILLPYQYFRILAGAWIIYLIFSISATSQTPCSIGYWALYFRYAKFCAYLRICDLI